VVLSIGATACEAQQEPADPAAQGDESQDDAMEGMSHGDDEDHGSSGQHGGQHDGQHDEHDSVSLSRDLVAPADLPTGYRTGAAHLHADPGAAAPKVDQACAPIAELIGTHPSVHQTKHPQATATFSKGHFGPLVTETVIDYGATSSAQEAQDRVERSGQECGRYVQSTSPIGANIYDVQSQVPDWTGPEGSTIRLSAVGSDFDGLHWDVWVTRSDSRLVAVSLRSVAGGSNEDLAPAIAAARAAIEES
jgi:hypothetical protein